MCRSAPHRAHVRHEHVRCDEKVTHTANVAAEANLQLAGRTESVTLPAPNHGPFLLHLKPRASGLFFVIGARSTRRRALARRGVRPRAAASVPAPRFRPA